MTSEKALTLKWCEESDSTLIKQCSLTSKTHFVLKLCLFIMGTSSFEKTSQKLASVCKRFQRC